MRERTPSADETPTRAPPAPPKEVHSADVIGSRAVSSAAEAFRATKLSSSTRMVASTHNLEELGVTHPASASNERHQQQEKHGHHIYRSTQTAQDKRSRLSNVINNLRKKVPETRSETKKEEDDRNSVERNLETLEKYVMTVLNGVIKDEEENQGIQVDGTKDDGDKSSTDGDAGVARGTGVGLKSEESRGSLEPSKPNEGKTEAAVPATDCLGKKINFGNDAAEASESSRNEGGAGEGSRVRAIEVDGLAEAVPRLVGTSDDGDRDEKTKEEVDKGEGDVCQKGLTKRSKEEESEVPENGGSRSEDSNSCVVDAKARSPREATACREEKVDDKGSSGSTEAKSVEVESDEKATGGEETLENARQEIDEDKNLQDRLMLRISSSKEGDDAEHDTPSSDRASADPDVDEERDESSSEMRDDLELRSICRNLLSDLLDDINRLIDSEQPKTREAASDEVKQNFEPSRASTQASETSTTSLHCSLPLEKVASVLQNCQTSEQANPGSLKSPAKPQSSSSVRHLCLYCDRKFPSVSLRQRHIERVHETGGGRRSERNTRKTSQSCQYCSDKCPGGLDDLFRHMIVSHGDKYHACLQCATRYLTREALLGHASDAHQGIVSAERTPPVEKSKETPASSSKNVSSYQSQSPRRTATSTKEHAGKDDSESRTEGSPKQSSPTSLTMALSNNAFSNPCSPEFDSSFYSSVSCNIRENLLHHLDGKLQTSASATPTESKQQSSFYEHNSSQIQFPIDISLTAATPVYNKEYSTEDYDNSSEYAQKPGKTRTHPRRVSFEKYNFPRKYDGKEQWTCSIKDLSKFDISTQLSLRKKQQLIKERITLSRLHQMPLPSSNKMESCSTTQAPLTELGSCRETETSCGRGNRGGENKAITSSGGSADESESTDRCNDSSPSPSSFLTSPSCDSPKCSTAVAKSTEFSIEFGNFMRLRKWEDNISETSKTQGTVYAELTGEWSRPRVYICGACTAKHVTLREMEDHKASNHPNVWCSHFEFSGDQRELYKHLFLPGRNVATAKARNAFLSEKICTKCSKNCSTLAELHRHMLECGGDQAWLLGLFGNGKKKCKWRPFGSRSRRRRQRGMKRNIQNSQTTRISTQKEKAVTSGPRVRPSDRESIQKMLANLPPKRATRKVLQDTKTRTQNNLRNMQTRSRPRLTTDSSSVNALSRNKTALKNKLLKNAKSFQRNLRRIDNIAESIESVVKDCSDEEEDDYDDYLDDEDDDGSSTASDKSSEIINKYERNLKSNSRSKVVKGVKVVSKKKNIKTKMRTSKSEYTRIRERVSSLKNEKSKTQQWKSSVNVESNSNLSTENCAIGASLKVAVKNSGKIVIAKNSSEKIAETKSSVDEDIDDKPTPPSRQGDASPSSSRKKKTLDPVVSLSASLKAKSQLRTHDGKFARNPKRRSSFVEMLEHNESVIRTRSSRIEYFATRSKLRAARNVRGNKRRLHASRRHTRLSSDSDKMPTLEPAVDLASIDENLGKRTDDLPILSPVASVSITKLPSNFKSASMVKADSSKISNEEQGKKIAEVDIEEVFEKSVIDVSENKNKSRQKDESQRQNGAKRGRKPKTEKKGGGSIDRKEITASDEEVDKEKHSSLADDSSEGTRQSRTRNKKNALKTKIDNTEVNSPKRSSHFRDSREDAGGVAKRNSVSQRRRNDVQSVQEVRDRSRIEHKRRVSLDDLPRSTSDVPIEIKRLIESPDFLTKFRDTSSTRSLRHSLVKLKSAASKKDRIQQEHNVANDRSVDSDRESSSDNSKIQLKRDQQRGLRKSSRKLEKKSPETLTKIVNKFEDDGEENETILEKKASEIATKVVSKPEDDEDNENKQEKKTREIATKVVSKLDDTVQKNEKQENENTPVRKIRSRRSSDGEMRGTKTIEAGLPSKCDKTAEVEKNVPEESSNTYLKSANKAVNPGKRRGRIKSNVEHDSTSAGIDSEEEHPMGTLDNCDKDKDPTKSLMEEKVNICSSSKDIVTTDLVNMSLEHLQQESSNSNVDSGKENTSVTPVNVPKLKATRPKKTKGARRERVAKRTLSSVIGILTEGVNIPVEVQQSVVLTVQTTVEPVNPESAAQNNSQQSNESNIAESGSANLDRDQKGSENGDLGFNAAASSASDVNLQPVDELQADQSASSERMSSGTTTETIDLKSKHPNECSESREPTMNDRKSDDSTEDQPANDIILDLSRRKPKGKGSFLEKIVSKIAKQKDALLEGEVGSLLDNAADELTSILDEVVPSLSEKTETPKFVAISDEKGETSKDEQVISDNNGDSAKVVDDDLISKATEEEEMKAGPDKEASGTTEPPQKQKTDVVVLAPSASDDSVAIPVQGENTSSINKVAGMEESQEKEKDAKPRRKSKKRSLDTTMPKKNKRKSIDEEVSEEENHSEEEICLADIMKLIQKPKEQKNSSIDRRIDPMTEPVQAKCRPGKRKTLEEEEEVDHNVNNVATVIGTIAPNETKETPTDAESSESSKKSKRKANKKKLQLKEAPLIEENKNLLETQEQNNHEKSVEVNDDVSSSLPKKNSKEKSSLDEESSKRPREESSSDSKVKRTSKKKAPVRDNSDNVASEELFSAENNLEKDIQRAEAKTPSLASEAIEPRASSRGRPSKKKQLIGKNLDEDEKQETNNLEIDQDSTRRVSKRKPIINDTPELRENRASPSEVLDVILSKDGRKNDSLADTPQQVSSTIDHSNTIESSEKESERTKNKKSTTSSKTSKSKKQVVIKSLADEHLELPDDPPSYSIPPELTVDSIEEIKLKKDVDSPIHSKKTSAKRKASNDIAADDKSNSTRSKSVDGQEDISTRPLEPFKVPEIRQDAYQSSKKRNSKRKSLVDEHLDLQDVAPFGTKNISSTLDTSKSFDEPELEKNDNSEKRKIGSKIANFIDNIPSNNERSSRSSEASHEEITEKKENANSVEMIADPSPATKRRSSKRRSVVNELLDPPDVVSSQDQLSEKFGDVSDTSCTSESSYSTRLRRSSKIKRQPPKNDFHESLDDVQTDTSVTDNESIDTERAGRFERRRTPRRKAKQNISLVDEHLDLPEDIDIPSEPDASKQVANCEDDNKLQIREEPTEKKPCDEEEEARESLVVSKITEEAVEKTQSTTAEEDANNEEDPSKEEFQAPKKRASGNFAVVHTKSGEILIVEKKKKLTKEVAKFFCDVCSTSFTRKSSLKKHNLSQSHLLQTSLASKEQDKDGTDVPEESSESIAERSEEHCEDNENSDVKTASDESQVELKLREGRKKDQPELDAIQESMEENMMSKHHTSAGISVSVDPVKPVLTPQASEEDALEDELLDEEICKITENMSHDEYVLTDHISPVLPEATSTPVKPPNRKSQPKSKKSKIDRTKPKPMNLAEEHLDLDSAEPPKSLKVSMGPCQDIDSNQTKDDMPREASTYKMASVSINASLESVNLLSKETTENVDLGISEKEITDKSFDNHDKVEEKKTAVTDLSAIRNPSCSDHSGEMSFPDFEESLQNKLQLNKDWMTLSRNDLPGAKESLRTEIGSIGDRLENLEKNDVVNEVQTELVPNLTIVSKKRINDTSLKTDKGLSTKACDTLNIPEILSTITARKTPSHIDGFSIEKSKEVPCNISRESPVVLAKLQNSPLIAQEIIESSESSFADKPLSELLSKALMQKTLNKMEQSTLDFSNITEKLNAQETLVADVVAKPVMTEFDSDENSLDTSISVDIQKLLDDPELTADNGAFTSKNSCSTPPQIPENDTEEVLEKSIDINADNSQEDVSTLVNNETEEIKDTSTRVQREQEGQMSLNDRIAENSKADGPTESAAFTDRQGRKTARTSKSSGNLRKSRGSRPKGKSSRKLARNKITLESSDESDYEDRNESQNKKRIVKSVFGRVFAGEKADKVKEVLDDWNSKSDDDSQKIYESIGALGNDDSSVESSKAKSEDRIIDGRISQQRSGSVSNDRSASPSPKRGSRRSGKRNRSRSIKRSNRERSQSADHSENDSGRRRTKSRNVQEERRKLEDANLSLSSTDVILPTLRCRQSKKRAEERISKAFEEDSLLPSDDHASTRKTSRSKEISYDLRNQSSITTRGGNHRSLREEDSFDDSDTLKQSSDLVTEACPRTHLDHTTSTSGKGRPCSSRKNKEKHEVKKEAGKNLTTNENETESKVQQKISDRDVADVTKAFSKNDLSNQNLEEKSAESKPSNAIITDEEEDEDDEDEEDMTHGRISPLFVCNTPETSLDTVSNSSSSRMVVATGSQIPRKRSSSEFSSERIVIRSPTSSHEDRPEVVTIAPTDAIEDNALDVPQDAVKSRQGKVLNFDEELFVECCSRLKATTENELRGAKKIKLDHSVEGAFHRREDQSGFRSTRDRWRDVESQNSLGSLLESVNQLLGEEMYSTREKNYSKRGRNECSENSSRSVSPSVDVSRPDNLGYEDSLDVAFEHNNKLRDKIQQRMRESEDLIANSFGGQRNCAGSFENRSIDERKSHESEESKQTVNEDNVQRDHTNVSNSNMSNGNYTNDNDKWTGSSEHTTKEAHLNPSGFKSKMNSTLGGLLDKALSNLLHSNGKHDHNGSTPMKVLAELACARAPTATNAEVSQIKVVSAGDESVPETTAANVTREIPARKPRNPIKELFERKKEMNERRQSEKSKAEAALKELDSQRSKKAKKVRKRQEFPLVRRGHLSGAAEKKKRRDGNDKKDESLSEKIKDIYDFDEEESQTDTGLGLVMPFRSKIEKSYEVSCLRTKEVDVAGLMSKAINETLENGKEGDALGRRLESMIDQKFKEIEKFAPKTKGALKSFQGDDKQSITRGPMDEVIERKQKAKKLSDGSSKHSKFKRKGRSSKKKSRNAWYENDSSDEFRTAAKTEDVGVGKSKSQRTCSKGKQNLFAELSTSSESEFEGDIADYETKVKSTIRWTKITDNEVRKHSEEMQDDEYSERVTGDEIDDRENEKAHFPGIGANETPKSSRNDTDMKKSESEMSDHPLIIDERKDNDEQKNSDDEADNQYDRSFELDDLYREDSSVTESESEEIGQPVENTRDIESTVEPNFQTNKPTIDQVLKDKYPEDNELIPLEEALDLLDPEGHNGTNDKTVEESTPLIAKSEELRATNQISKESEQALLDDNVSQQDEDEIDLPEKLTGNEKPQKESDNLPLHVFLSRKVQESKKRKQQQLKKMQEEQEKILMELQPTRRQRKCAIGKQGLLAEISSTDDEESYLRDVCRRSVDRADSDRPRKPKRESKEKRKERYIEKKHEQMIAKEQKAIEEEILREIEMRKETRSKDLKESDNEIDDSNGKAKDKESEDGRTNVKKRPKLNSKKSSTESQENEENNDQLEEYSSEAEDHCDKSEHNSASENNSAEDYNPDSFERKKKQLKASQKTKRFAKPNRKTAGGNNRRQNPNSDRSKNRSLPTNGKDLKERRSSSAKRDSDDEELRTTKSWNKVEEGVGVAIGRRKRASANQLYYWSSSSDEEEPVEPVRIAEDEEEDDRQEQHGWIVGDSHKKMITMLAMEKQQKEKRRRSEDEFEPGKMKNKKHRNSTS